MRLRRPIQSLHDSLWPRQNTKLANKKTKKKTCAEGQRRGEEGREEKGGASAYGREVTVQDDAPLEHTLWPAPPPAATRQLTIYC